MAKTPEQLTPDELAGDVVRSFLRGPQDADTLIKYIGAAIQFERETCARIASINLTGKAGAAAIRARPGTDTQQGTLNAPLLIGGKNV